MCVQSGLVMIPGSMNTKQVIFFIFSPNIFAIVDDFLKFHSAFNVLHALQKIIKYDKSIEKRKRKKLLAQVALNHMAPPKSGRVGTRIHH